MFHRPAVLKALAEDGAPVDLIANIISSILHIPIIYFLAIQIPLQRNAEIYVR